MERAMDVRQGGDLFCIGVTAACVSRLLTSDHAARARDLSLLELPALVAGELDEVALAVVDASAFSDNEWQKLADFCKTGVPVLLLGGQQRLLPGALSYVDRVDDVADMPGLRAKIEHWLEFADQRRMLQKRRDDQCGPQSDEHGLRARFAHATAVRDRFMSTFAHELRSPLNGLILDAQLRRLQISRGNLKAFLPERLEVLFERDEQQVLRLISLVEGLQDVSRILAGEVALHPQECDVIAILRKVISACSESSPDQALDIELEAPGIGYWDPDRLEQVLTHLLRNAQCYGTGAPIHLRLYAEGSALLLSVKDFGMGVAEIDQSRIFEAFERLDSARSRAGLGMGLYVSRAIARAHGGDIELRSALGQGATFTLRLPLQAAVAASY